MSRESTRTDTLSADCVLTVVDLCERFMTDYAMIRYRTSSGSPSAEVDCYRSIFTLLREHFGEWPASKFRAMALRNLRQKMVEKGWSRGFVNKQTARVKHLFRISASWEMVETDVLASLDSVPSLAPGETEAPDYQPRQAVPEEHIQAVRVVMIELHRDITDLLLLCGARPGELLSLTTGMIDRSGDVWRCVLDKHKTAHRGKRRVLFFNARAQMILRRYLTLDPDKKLFPIRRGSYSAAVRRCCERAGVPPFVPHQLRHTVATKIVDEMGIDAAQRVLGHSERAMTEHYSRVADRAAIAAVQRLG